MLKKFNVFSVTKLLGVNVDLISEYVMAILLGLVRVVRSATNHAPSNWEMVAVYAFLFVTFFVNTACAAFAALGQSNVRRNIAMVLVVAILVGVVMATAMTAKPPYDPIRDFTHIALFGGAPNVLGVHPSVPARDVKGFVALAKARPGACWQILNEVTSQG